MFTLLVKLTVNIDVESKAKGVVEYLRYRRTENEYQILINIKLRVETPDICSVGDKKSSDWASPCGLRPGGFWA